MEFKYDLRDLKFILKEWLPSEEVSACDRFKENFGIEDIDILLNEAYKVAREIINPINAPGDKVGVKLENGVVTPAPGFKEAYRFLQENGMGLDQRVHRNSTPACPLFCTSPPMNSTRRPALP